METMASNGGAAGQKRSANDGNDSGSESRLWKRWARAEIVVQKAKGTPPEALGPRLYTLLDGQAALALESVDICDINLEGAEDVVFERLDDRFPDKVAADRLGDAMDGTFALCLGKHETTEAYTGRARLIFAKLTKEGVDLPAVAQGYLVLQGARLGSLGRATIMSATHKSWHVEGVCTAIRAAFPGVPPDRWLHAAYATSPIFIQYPAGPFCSLDFPSRIYLPILANQQVRPGSGEVAQIVDHGRRLICLTRSAGSATLPDAQQLCICEPRHRMHPHRYRQLRTEHSVDGYAPAEQRPNPRRRSPPTTVCASMLFSCCCAPQRSSLCRLTAALAQCPQGCACIPQTPKYNALRCRQASSLSTLRACWLQWIQHTSNASPRSHRHAIQPEVRNEQTSLRIIHECLGWGRWRDKRMVRNKRMAWPSFEQTLWVGTDSKTRRSMGRQECRQKHWPPQ